MATLRNSILTAAFVVGIAPGLAQAASGKFTAADYQRALWMTTRFYGGQRSGVGPNWLQMDSPYPTNYVNDAVNGIDVSGGWFDCGDHEMYGQTQYWSAYTLAQAYESFPTGFDDLYDGANYSDYEKSQNFDITGGVPNRIPDIIDELVYETDFIAKAAISETQFVAKKGVGNLDHSLWLTPGYESANKKSSEGGSSDGSRPITVDQGDGSMACYAAATLSIMSRNLTRLGIYPSRASLYAQKAVVAYNYAKGHQATVAVNDGGSYPANVNFSDDFATASLEMYRLTNDPSYLNTGKALATSFKWGNNGLCYNDNEPQAFYNLYAIGGLTSSLSQLTGSSGVMNRYTTNVNSEGVSTVGDNWGALRYPLNGAYLGGLVDQRTGTDTYDQFIYNQIDYVMGSNTAKRSFITGFCSGCNSQPMYPQHRGIYLVNDLTWDKFNATGTSNGLSIPARNKYHGSLYGGSRTSTGFTESISNATTNEVCTDYNVGLVGALAYIVSKLAPVDTSKFRVTALHSRTGAAFDFSANATGRTILLSSSAALQEILLTDLHGRVLAQAFPGTSTYHWIAPGSGIYLTRVRTASGWASSKVMVQ
jgi:hypothetical protein